MNYVAIPGLKNPAQINTDDIVNKVCGYYGYDPTDVKKKCRKREMVTTRRMCIYFLKKRTSMTLKAIADIFEQDHTSVIHALETQQDFIYIKDEPTIDAIRQINSLLNS